MDAPVLVLTLDPDDPINTTFLSSSGKLLYKVSATRTSRGSAIRVSDAFSANVATLEMSDFGLSSSRVRIGEGKPVAYGKWLSRSILPFERDVTMKDESGRKYKWRENGHRKMLQLFTAEDGTHPIASFSQTLSDDGTNRLVATLALDARAEEIRDQVVASFVFLERERRAQEGTIERRAASETGRMASNLLSNGTAY
ncbi:uncharacterized protein C8Q71DRAFT_750092 [Rhodofomes roseus]|uniref:DUF6593 domain-containing protein n=1 Tax=Rhodofomes roseus TaxID=34475 RepID=A0ABQ8KJX4_9APHY|nr:uncharacterized protein C8Q71DRAFT_750092 [Rhodofomes roseus]KAH9838228.1 hypothetical protein C8Q71DRAFT_750092 [Rhodofomes roseus]